MTHVSVGTPAQENAPPDQSVKPEESQSQREQRVEVQQPEQEAPPESKPEDREATPQQEVADRAAVLESEPVDKDVQAVEDVPTQTVEPPSSAPNQNVEDVPTQTVEPPSSVAHVNNEQDVDLLPTSPLEVAGIERSQVKPVEEPPTSPLPSQPSEPTDESPYDVEYLSTTPLATPQKALSQPGNTVIDAPEQGEHIDNNKSVVKPRVPAPHTPLPVHEPVDEAAQRASAPRAMRTHTRLPIVVGAVALLVLIVGGLGIWIVAAQPFSVAPITRPQLGFSNAQLGIALSYPNGWTQQVTPGAAHFFASNHTAEANIEVASAADAKQALQQRAAKLGLSGTKAEAEQTFAGTTWQQVQGNLQQSGANYTVTLLAAIHGGHLYTLIEQAPQSNYADWEQAFFSPLRGSLRFL